VGNRNQLLCDGCCKLTRCNATFGGTGAETRDWVEVTEAAALLVKAAEAATPNCPIYNGGRGIPTSTRAVLECLARALGTKADISFSGVRLPGDPKHLVADITDTLSLGWQPSRSIEPQLEAYARWFRGLS
jgi:UDP-glucose 4-epimerase